MHCSLTIPDYGRLYRAPVHDVEKAWFCNRIDQRQVLKQYTTLET